MHWVSLSVVVSAVDFQWWFSNAYRRFEIVMEYMPLGSLYDYMKTNTIPWPDRDTIAQNIAAGVSFVFLPCVLLRQPTTANPDALPSLQPHPPLRFKIPQRPPRRRQKDAGEDFRLRTRFRAWVAGKPVHAGVQGWNNFVAGSGAL